jgi:hypothetical protein
MIQQAKSNPQLLEEQIFSERFHLRFLLLGLFGHADRIQRCPILGAKRKSDLRAVRSAFLDPKRTLAVCLPNRFSLSEHPLTRFARGDVDHNDPANPIVSGSRPASSRKPCTSPGARCGH